MSKKEQSDGEVFYSNIKYYENNCSKMYIDPSNSAKVLYS